MTFVMSLLLDKKCTRGFNLACIDSELSPFVTILDTYILELGLICILAYGLIPEPEIKCIIYVCLILTILTSLLLD